MSIATTTQHVGGLLRDWRQRRRLSQLDLACEADISTRHLSFLENGRAQPSRDMVLHLAERLEVPLRDRNVMLIAAGFAPMFTERPLADPALGAARRAVELILAGHEPYPALAVDRHWQLVAANAAVNRLLAGVDPALLQPPVNVLRLSLHPQGMAPRIENLGQWRGHLLERLRRQVDVTGDMILNSLLGELRSYPAPRGAQAHVAGHEYADVVVPLRLRSDAGLLSLVSTTTVFGTPLDITLSELALESFYPADASTAEALRNLAAKAA
jgi:transcriptional regulator with XRE-family HTH domain